MEVRVKVRGIEEVARNMDKLQEELSQELAVAVEREAFRIEGLAKEFCPVDTGRLRSSIHAEMTATHTAKISDGVQYGVFVEFGTSKMGAQPFFRPAVDASMPQFETDLRAALDKTSLPKR